MTRQFLDLADAGGDAIAAILEDALRRKQHRGAKPNGAADSDAPLAGYTLAMIFEKNSTRTRVSFDMALSQLGGSTNINESGSMQLGRGASIADPAPIGRDHVLTPDTQSQLVSRLPHEQKYHHH